MTTIYDALNSIRNSATSEKDKGTQYERLARYYLKIDQLWRNRFSDIWMWGDAPTNDGADIGIDLVAKDAADGSLWAIQCKCYDDDSTLHYGDVATFYGKTGNQGTYSHTMIVTSAGRLSGHLDSVADKWGTVRIFSDDMKESEIDFEPFFTGEENAAHIIHEARPHQIQAINDCVKGFEENDRGQLIMACGTGKTLTALRLSSILASQSDGITVIFDRFGKKDFEERIVKSALTIECVDDIHPEDSQREAGLQFIDNICSVIRRHISGKDNFSYFEIIKEYHLIQYCLIFMPYDNILVYWQLYSREHTT